MKILRILAIILLLSIFAICGLAIQSRSPYPISQIRELPAQLRKTSEIIRNIKSDDDFERNWPELSGEIRQIDSMMQELLRFGYSQGGNAEFTDEDYEALFAARDDHLKAHSLLDNNVSSANSKLARSVIRSELDPRTAAWQRFSLPVAKFAKSNKLPLSLFGGVLICIIGLPVRSSKEENIEAIRRGVESMEAGNGMTLEESKRRTEEAVRQHAKK